MFHNIPHKKTGFTLAEVLITLLIIGVVSSLIIPMLINEVHYQQYKICISSGSEAGKGCAAKFLYN